MKKVREQIGGVFRWPQHFRRETGRSLAFWTLLALLNFATQIVFRRHLAPGEFGMLNTLIAVIGLFLVPIWALRHCFDHFAPKDHDAARLATLRAGKQPLVEIATVGWIAPALLLGWLLVSLLDFPRESLGYCALPGVFLALGAFVAASMCEKQDRLRLWGVLLFGAALMRIAVAAWFTASEPWAEMGLVAGWAGAFVVLIPVWRAREFTFDWKKAAAAWRDREFARHAVATFSVLLGLYLFTNGDRIVAQAWFGRPQENNMGFVPWDFFDHYQTAGLLGRAILWGTQPLLLLLLVRRAGAPRTTPALRNLFWLYLGVLIVAGLAVSALAHPLTSLFCGTDDAETAMLVPGFAWLMMPLGLLQGLGIFSLASRRYPECYTLCGASLGYVALLYAVGRPQLMLSYAFGGAWVALMLVLIVGIVRWGRRQP
jgi:O-antigen/teichoic acid export membrane protein